MTEVGHASNGLLSLSVTAGTTYHIAIDGTATSPYGIAVLNWQFTGPDTAYIDNDIPFLPPWALAAMALMLMGMGVRYGKLTHVRMMVLLGGTMTLGLMLLPLGTHTAPVPAPALVPGTWYYVHTDHLGTPRTMTDVNQNVVWRWDSDPFGVGAPNEDPDADGIKVTMNLRFPGQYYDAESGLHYNYHRYYDPATGRYTNSDPIGLQGGLNTYGYVGGNPIYWIDPSGQFAQVLVPVVVYGTAAVLISVYLYQEVQRAGERGIPGIVPPGSTITPIAEPVIPTWTPNENAKEKSRKSKPKNCPTGTIPIDQGKGKFGWDKDDVHDIKDAVDAGPEDWTGVSPDGRIWTGDGNGNAVEHGPWKGLIR